MKKIALFVVLLLFCGASTPPTIKWVAIGDSITYLNDYTGQTDGRITQGYMSLITARNPQVQYINQGHNGWTSIGIADKIETLGLVSADVYTIFLGTNDWWQGKPLGTISDYKDNIGNSTVFGAFRVITSKLKQLNGKAKIILITPMQRGDFVQIKNFRNNAFGSYKEKNGQHLEDFAKAVIEIGKLEGFPVVDLFSSKKMNYKKMVHFKRLKDPSTGQYRNYTYPDYTEIPFNPETDEYPYPKEAIYMTYDGLHPSDAGYKVIAKMLAKKWKGVK